MPDEKGSIPDETGSMPPDEEGEQGQQSQQHPDEPVKDEPVKDHQVSADRRRRTVRSLLHPGKGQIIAAVLLLIFGMGGVMQIRSNTEDQTYSTARREDLIQLLDGLSQESRRLEGEIGELERTRTQLQSGADTFRVAREEARKRVETLSILAGTVPATGPGVRIRIADPHHKVSANLLLDAIEEMRDAGAEVIEFNNTVRVVGSSWIGSGASGLMVDGQKISSPIVIKVIGNPHALQEAAQFRGGLVSEITGPKVGGQVVIEQLDEVEIDSLHEARDNQYARPASPPPTPR